MVGATVAEARAAAARVVAAMAAEARAEVKAAVAASVVETTHVRKQELYKAGDA